MEEITVSNDMEIGNSCAAYSIESIKMDVPFNIISLNVTLSLKLCRATESAYALCTQYTHTHPIHFRQMRSWNRGREARLRHRVSQRQLESKRARIHTRLVCRLRDDYDVSKLRCLNIFIRVFMTK